MISESVLQAIERTGALPGKAALIVAVSGGCDSVALLHILRALQTRLDTALHIASLDHGIRGQAGRRDVDFARGLAERWQLPFTADSVDVPALAREWRMGIEAAARRARYDFLARVAGQESSSLVALGQHANDQAETVLMNIIRGSGARGLGGMRTLSPMPYHPEIKLLRPLLSLTREQLQAYCAQHDLSYCNDETNDDIRFSRNFLRLKVMPRLARLNPDAPAAFGRLADALAVDEDFFTEVFATQVMPMLDLRAGQWRIDKQAFFALHPALQRRALREIFRRLTDTSDSLSHQLTLDLLDWARRASVGAKRDIGASIELLIDYESLWIKHQGSQITPAGYRLIPADTCIVISPSAPYMRDGLNISLAVASPSIGPGVDIAIDAGSAVRLRTRRDGDRFKPKGMGGRSQKLKEWMINRKIPHYVRDRIPLVTVDGELIAICLGRAWRLAEMDSSAAAKDVNLVLRLA